MITQLDHWELHDLFSRVLEFYRFLDKYEVATKQSLFQTMMMPFLFLLISRLWEKKTL